ncbi:MAG: hypothetical protein IJW55_01390 [Clostridia bacterium]|nr:hypothetical protein [Clostridia bacterium]
MKMMKKLLSMLLIISMLSGMALIAPSAAEQRVDWVEIATEADLSKLVDEDNYDKNFKLTADITMTGTWETVDYYEGCFDGDGHKIIFTQKQSDPMFDTIGGIVKNLVLENMSVEGTNNEYTVGLVNKNNGQIWNIEVVNATITGPGKNVGLINLNNGVVSHVTLDATIKGAGDRAGIICWNSEGATVRYCMSYGTYLTNFQLGGIVGNNLGTIENCLNFATVVAINCSAGGVSGPTRSKTAKIINCGNYGTVIAMRPGGSIEAVAGGITFMEQNTVLELTNSFNAGKVIVKNGTNMCGSLVCRFTESLYQNTTVNLTNSYSVENMLYTFDQLFTAETAGTYADATYSQLADNAISVCGVNGTLVSADTFKSPEMLTKLGSAFVANTGEDKDLYPILLAADTTEEPMPEGEEVDPDPGTTNPPATGDNETEPTTEPVTEPVTKPVTNSTEANTSSVDEDDSGCSSTIGGVSVVLIGFAAMASVMVKKKKED